MAILFSPCVISSDIDLLNFVENENSSTLTSPNLNRLYQEIKPNTGLAIQRHPGCFLNSSAKIGYSQGTL